MNRPTALLAVAVTCAALGFLAREFAACGPAAEPPTAGRVPPAGCYLHARNGSPAWYVTRQPRDWQELESLSVERVRSDPRWSGVVKVYSRKSTPDTDIPTDASCWRRAAGLLLVGDPAFLDEAAEAVARDTRTPRPGPPPSPSFRR